MLMEDTPIKMKALYPLKHVYKRSVIMCVQRLPPMVLYSQIEISALSYYILSYGPESLESRRSALRTSDHFMPEIAASKVRDILR